MNISQLPDDVVRNILGYLPHQLVLNNKRVCSRWHRIINDWRFLTAQFPVFKCSNLPQRKTAQLVADMNAYGKITKVSFKGGHLLSKAPLQKLSVSFQKLTLVGEVLPEDKDNPAIDILMSKLTSSLGNPASLSLKGLSFQQTIRVFENCLQSNVLLQKLKLRNTSSHGYMEQTRLNNYIQKLAFEFHYVLPLHLDLGNEYWVSPETITNLAYQGGVRFSFLSAKIVVSYNAFPSIPATQLTSPCTVMPRSPMCEEFLNSVIARNLKLTQVDFSGNLTNNLICSIFESHLTSPCKVNIMPSALTTQLLEVINRKNMIFDKLTLKDGYSLNPNDADITLWKELLSQNRIKSISTETLLSMSNVFKSFPAQLTTKNLLQKLKLEGLVLELFTHVVQSALCSGNKFSLSVRGDFKVDTINLLVKSNLQFKKLRYNSFGKVGYFLSPLVDHGSLDHCEKLFLSSCFDDQYVSLRNLSQRNTSLKTLQFSFDRPKDMTALLANPKTFPLLNRLIVNGNKIQWQPLVMKIQATRPNIVVEYTD